MSLMVVYSLLLDDMQWCVCTCLSFYTAFIAFVYSCRNMEFFRVSSPITSRKGANSYVCSDDYNCE